MINKTISVCEQSNIETWAVAGPSILKYINSNEYEVVVPDNQIEIFRAVTPNKISVVPESVYIGERNLTWVQSLIPPTYERRAGWYLQQFIKIEACRASKSDEMVLIWDAETVPLKSLEFEDSDGRLLYYRGNHKPIIHEPYFDLILKLLGLNRLREVSFISQSFPTRVAWVKAMCSEIEVKYQVESWIDAVLANVDHTAGLSGFSEYETLGTYISHHYADEYKFSDCNYFRNGTQLIGSPDLLMSNKQWSNLKSCIDYIAFENYQTEKIRGISIGSGNAQAVVTPQGNAVINVDLQKYDEVDLIVNIEKAWPFPNSFFEQVIANNILEHVNDILPVISEIDRCLAVGGLLKIEVPFIGSYNHGTDVTHKRGLTYDSF